MTTHHCRSSDGTTIVYDVSGHGEALLLLHGGFVQDRRIWFEQGWVAELSQRHRVICPDLRGHGESSHPTATAAYTRSQLKSDLRAVLDAEGVTRASVVGYSLGAILGARIAARVRAVTHLVLLGGAFGPPIPEDMRQLVLARLAELEAARARGETLPLAPHEAAFVRHADLGVARAMYTAMEHWGHIEPEDLGCRTLFLAGTKHPWSMACLEHYRDRFRANGIRVALLRGATHETEIKSESNAVAHVKSFLMA